MSRDRKKKRNQQSSNLEPIQNEIITHDNPAPHTKKSVRIIPKNERQEEYLEQLMDPKRKLIVVSGPAGTGKTYLAMLAGIKSLQAGQVKKIVLSRPAVGADDESHGFLPGTLFDKMEPWVMPLMDVLIDYYSAKELACMIENKVICIEPLMYLRGRNIENAWVVFDEAQNSSKNQMLMLLTRMCEGSKIIVTGDPKQKDKKFFVDNGLDDLIEKLKKNPTNMLGYIEFEKNHIERSELVKLILSMY